MPRSWEITHKWRSLLGTKPFILLACFLSLLTSVVFNCEDISRWNLTKNTQAHKEKNWNRIDSRLSFFFFVGLFISCWKEDFVWKFQMDHNHGFWIPMSLAFSWYVFYILHTEEYKILTADTSILLNKLKIS